MGLLVLLFLLSFGGSSSALTNSSISISGVVPPMRFIVLNRKHQIIKIVSNTKLQVTPEVWVGSIGRGRQITLSNALLKSYYLKIRGRYLGDGVLNFNNIAKANPRSSGLMSYVSMLRLPGKLMRLIP